MARFDDKKFELYKDFFDIRQAVKEVVSALDFQITLKNLRLIIEID